MESKVDQIIANEEMLYKFDEEYQEKLLKDRPWVKEY
jgi:hypothetical protein